ncbi:MAG: nucleotidyltransferase domain-containing protein [Chloroflexi bacterium]|nr:nucleotidyltransferase domain-containing protein [Chloroflexota bacterium]
MKTRIALSSAPITINGTRIKPKDAVHRRKLKALGFFLQRLRASPVGKNVARAVLFGSVAKGTAKRDSDIDVLLFTRTREDEESRDARYDLQQEVWENFDEHIEAHLYPLAEYVNPTSYLVYRATRHGKAFNRRRAQRLKVKEIQERIARVQEDLRAARHLIARFPRGAMMPAYNAAEFCAKSLILLEADDLPGSRHGVITALKETRASAFVPRLRQALKWHIEAAYKLTDTIGAEETRCVIALAEEMLVHLNERVRDDSEQENRSRH